MNTPSVEQFRSFGMALFGYGWQSSVARALNVSSRTVRRWSSGETPVPTTAWEELQRLAGGDERGKPEWSRDEWLIADGEDQRQYIIHAIAPRFIARLVETEPDSDTPAAGESDADTLSGITYAADSELLMCEIVWLDAPPQAGHDRS